MDAHSSNYLLQKYVGKYVNYRIIYYKDVERKTNDLIFFFKRSFVVPQVRLTFLNQPRCGATLTAAAVFP